MTYYPHPRRRARKDHFPLANSLFDYALAPGALMIFAYLSYLCFLIAPFVGETCRGVSRALGMSENTVRKYVGEPEEQMLIETERKRDRALVQKKLDRQRKAPVKEVRTVASHVVHESEELPF